MKAEIIKLGTHLGVPFDKTWSCDLGGDIACGECGCCWTRRHAFKKAGIPDGQTYLKDMLEKAVWAMEGREFKTNLSTIEDLLERVKAV